MEKFIAKTNKGENREFNFKLSENGQLVWCHWYVDTLMESAENYLKGQGLYIDSGADYSITNMDEWVRFMFKNRWDIEQELRKGVQ